MKFTLIFLVIFLYTFSYFLGLKNYKLRHFKKCPRSLYFTLLIGSKFLSKLVASVQEIYWHTFWKKWLLHDDLIAEASTFPRLGSTGQYTNFQISASISRMELKFSPNNFKLVPCWSLVGPFLVPCWSLLRNPYCHDFAHEYITVQNTSILHTGV